GRQRDLFESIEEDFFADEFRMAGVERSRQLVRLTLVNVEISVVGDKDDILTPGTKTTFGIVVFNELVYYVPGFGESDHGNSSHPDVHGMVHGRIFLPFAFVGLEETKVVVRGVGLEGIKGISRFISRDKVG